MLTDPLDVFDFVVNQGHGIRGLSAIGLTQVPSNYIQPLEEQFDASKVVTDESIPVIDFSNLDDLACSSICDAAAHYGFFQVVNHDIPTEVMEEVKSAAHRFFELPTSEKVKYKTEEFAGARLGTSFRPANEKVLEWKDFLSLQYTTDDAASQIWPSICKDQVLNYYTRLKVMVIKIYDILLKGLNVEIGFDESKKSLLMGWISIHFNYYPPCPNPNLTVGIGRHSDASALTVLLQDDVGGLYVRAPNGGAESWVHVPPRSGALVINVGDMLQVMSNGRYKSVEHKVVASPSKNRVSVAVFLKPALTQVVAPLQEVLKSTGEQRRYRDVVYGDYFKYLLSKGHDGKATVEWTKI